MSIYIFFDSEVYFFMFFNICFFHVNLLSLSRPKYLTLSAGDDFIVMSGFRFIDFLYFRNHSSIALNPSCKRFVVVFWITMARENGNIVCKCLVQTINHIAPNLYFRQAFIQIFLCFEDIAIFRYLCYCQSGLSAKNNG